MKVTTKDPFVLVTYALVKDGGGEVHTALVPYNVSVKVAKAFIEGVLNNTGYEAKPIAILAKKVRHYTFDWVDGDTYNEALSNSLRNEGLDISFTFIDDEAVDNLEVPSMDEAMNNAKVGE